MKTWWPNPDDIQSWLVARNFHSRDWGLLSSALARPLTVLMGQEAYPTIWLKLAALLDSVQRNHPLLDGNKRLGYLLVSLILRGNGLDESHVSDDAWYELIVEVASERVELDELAARLKERVQDDGGSRIRASRALEGQ